jgi:hypothetical protein
MPLKTITQIDDIVEGDTVVISCTFTDTEGTGVDPELVELSIQEHGDPLPAPIVKTKAAAELMNPLPGVWEFSYKADVAGKVKYHFYGETPATSSARGAKGVLNVESAL